MATNRQGSRGAGKQAGRSSRRVRRAWHFPLTGILGLLVNERLVQALDVATVADRGVHRAAVVGLRETNMIMESGEHAFGMAVVT